MAATLAGDDLARSLSSRRSFASNSRRSWVATASFREAWNAPSGVFNRSERQDDEEELWWAAIERLPTYERLRKGVIRQVLDNGKVVHGEVDVTNLGKQDKKRLMESILKVVEEDNEEFLRRLRDRIDRVGIEVPKIEVRYEHLSVEGDVHVGSRALPSLINCYMNAIESVLGFVPPNKRKIQILKETVVVNRPTNAANTAGVGGTTVGEWWVVESEDNDKYESYQDCCTKKKL